MRSKGSVMSEKLMERIGPGVTLVSDGAIGTLLMERGLRAGMCPESFNLDEPEVLGEIALLYVEAGADIVHTNTFGASSLNLQSHGMGDNVEAINRIGITAVQRAVGDRAMVSLSCGPTGRILEPYGDAKPDAVYGSYEQQIGFGVDDGIDAVTVETMIDLE